MRCCWATVTAALLALLSQIQQHQSLLAAVVNTEFIRFFPSPSLSCRRFTIGKKGMIVFHERAIRERGGCNCKQLRWITKSDNKGRPHANYPFVTNKPNKRGQNNRRRRRGDKEGRQKKVAFMEGREGAEAKLEALEILINFFLRVDRKINVLGGVMVP